jgi:uncharacterized OsmC-like protein
MNTNAKTAGIRNGIDLNALGGVVEEIGRDASKAKVRFHVTSAWQGQTRSETRVEAVTLGGQKVARDFRIAVDEPTELLGGNTAPNPQEMLMAAVNACMMVGYVAGAAVRGVTLKKLEIETDGELDLRGFLGLDDKVSPGYETLHYTVRIDGDGTREQFEEIHRNVMRTSPNFHNMARGIVMDGRLVVG